MTEKLTGLTQAEAEKRLKKDVLMEVHEPSFFLGK